MRRVVMILFWVVLLLSIISCDRFERDFVPVITQTPEEFIKEFESSASISLRSNKVSEIMSSYDKNYLNYVENEKFYYRFRDIENYFSETTWSEDAYLTVTPTRNKGYMVILSDEQNIDKQRSWNDNIEYNTNSKKYFWKGNQIRKEIPHVVIAQNFTSVTCVNCHIPANKLLELYENPSYKDKFIYLKYYGNNKSPYDTALTAYNQFSDEYNYYKNKPVSINTPTTIFQGLDILVGADKINEFESTIQNISNRNAEVELEIISASLDGGTEEPTSVTGSTIIYFESDLDTTSLYLYCVVYVSEVSGHHYQAAPSVQATHVVRARKMVPISGIESGDEVEFTVDLPPLGEKQATQPKRPILEDDSYLVVWVQNIKDTSKFTSGVDKILNATQVKIK